MLPKRRFGEHAFRSTFQRFVGVPIKRGLVWVLKDAHSFVSSAFEVVESLCFPNRRLGGLHKRGNADFRNTFQGREYSIWATNRGKVLHSKSGFHRLFTIPKSSFQRLWVIAFGTSDCPGEWFGAEWRIWSRSTYIDLVNFVEVYPTQTKILEGGTKDEMMSF
jgi:hypothetical protein